MSDCTLGEIRGLLLGPSFLGLSAPIIIEKLDIVAAIGISRNPEQESAIKAARGRLRNPQGNTSKGSPLREDLVFLLEVAGD